MHSDQSSEQDHAEEHSARKEGSNEASNEILKEDENHITADKKDAAQVSEPVEPPPATTPAPVPTPALALPAPTVPFVATKKPSAKPRTSEQKAYDDALAAQEKAAKVVEATRLKLAESERRVTFLVGQKAVHETLLNMDQESRVNTLSDLLNAADAEKKQAVINYLDALNSLPISEKKGE